MAQVRTILMGASLALAAIPAAAQTAGSAWTFGGFGTLGASQSSTGDAEYLRDQTQPLGVTKEVSTRMDSRLGLQVSGTLTDTLRATVQVVSKYRYDKTFAPDLTWALLAWTPTPDLQIRAGRLGFDVFMDSDSRDVGYSFLWARPPVEYFGGLPVSHLDGLDLSRDFALGESTTLRLKAYGGQASGKLPVGGTVPLNLGGSPLMGCLGELTTGPWRARLGYAQFKPRHDFPPPLADVQAGLSQFSVALGDPKLAQAAESLNFARHTVRYSSAAVSYDQDGLQVQTALARFRSNAVISPDSWSGFVSVGYRIGKVVPYGAWSRIVSSRPVIDLGMLPYIPTPEAEGLIHGLDLILKASQNDQHTYTLGTRINLANQACLKLQVDRSESHNATALWSKVKPNWDGKATVLTATLDFVF